MSAQAKLTPSVLDISSVDQQPTRKGYGEGLLEAGEKAPHVVALLCADQFLRTIDTLNSGGYS